MSSAIGSMHIVCPHCTTSYAVDPTTFGAAGRTVRCARCKDVWLARPEELPRPRELAIAASRPDPDEDLSAWGVTDDEPDTTQIPVVDSPSISADLPPEPEPEPAPDRNLEADWTVAARDDDDATRTPVAARPGPSRLGTSKLGAFGRLKPGMPQLDRLSRHALALTTAVMAGLILAVLIWRVDIVRLLPQTIAFYQGFGIDVNIRGLAFKDVKASTETVDGKPVMVIEGLIVSETRVPTAMPRLRFVVRDDKGTEVYAWSAVLEQPGLNPGDKAWFRSRLASPPADGRSIDVRFFNRRDVAGT